MDINTVQLILKYHLISRQKIVRLQLNEYDKDFLNCNWSDRKAMNLLQAEYKEIERQLLAISNNEII